MTRYRVDPDAQGDLDEIYDYVANDSVAAGDGLIDTFKDEFGLLASEIGEGPRFRDNGRASAGGELTCKQTGALFTAPLHALVIPSRLYGFGFAHDFHVANLLVASQEELVACIPMPNVHVCECAFE